MPAGIDAGILLRDIDLRTLAELTVPRGVCVAIDIDTVRGLASDEAAIDFVCNRLGIEIVLTRRPYTARQVAGVGGLGLLQVLAFDSTGVARSLESHPGEGVGTVITPGLVLAHMRSDVVARLPRPILAYGLIERPADALAALALADAVALAPQPARNLATAFATIARSTGTRLTSPTVAE